MLLVTTHAYLDTPQTSMTRRKMQHPLHDQAQNYLARSTLVPDSVSDQIIDYQLTSVNLVLESAISATWS